VVSRHDQRRAKPIDRGKLLETAAQYLDAGSGGTAAVAPAKIPGSTGPISSTLANDPVMVDIVAEFVAGLPGKVAALSTLAAADNVAELRMLVHQLKGAGGTYGFDSITTEAGGLESQLKTCKSVEQARREIDALIALIRSVEGYKPAMESTRQSVP